MFKHEREDLWRQLQDSEDLVDADPGDPEFPGQLGFGEFGIPR